jgi:hypothetical protein
MKKEFVPYELALKMKQLGFDEPCFAYYYTLNGRDWKFAEKTEYYKLDDNMNIGGKYTISAPLFQQAFRWFREKYNLRGFIGFRPNIKQFDCHIYDMSLSGKEYVKQRTMEEYNKDPKVGTYEEAELACLEKLIEIVEQTNAEMTDHGVYK